MKQKFLELKYQQLLKDYKELTLDAVRSAKVNAILQDLIVDLAHHMNLTDIGKLTPEEIISSAKGRITKIHLVS